MTLKLFLLQIIGAGAYGVVLQGVDTTSGTSLAVKKSRVSIRVKRTHLHYEAKILQALSGHPAIPAIYGYGRFPHFEYLAMERCGSNVEELAQLNQGGTQLKTVILLALQMISVLQHIHSHGFVHRDVKADHMLISPRDPNRIIFIDYGLASPRSESAGQRYDPETERKGVIGTITWASLNSHRGHHLSWRDDLESLAYVLLFLLRGKLPWVSSPKRSTVIGAMTRVRMAKMKWSGSQLAHGHPPEFGHFLDQTRALEFDETPPYERYMELFEDLYQRSGFSNADRSFDWTPVPSSPAMLLLADPTPEEILLGRPRLALGQIIVAQLMREASILGIMPDDDLWSLFESQAETSTSLRPAVVVNAFTDFEGLQHVLLAPLARGSLVDSPLCRSVRFCPGDLETIPPWPLDDTYCYVFPQPIWCVVGTVQGDTEYCVRKEDLPLLQSELSELSTKTEMLDQPDRQLLVYIGYSGSKAHPVARIGPLRPPGEGLDWAGTRGWFDEIRSIYTHRAADNGDERVLAGPKFVPEDSGQVELSNSYVDQGWDYRQHDRPETLTLRNLPPSLLLERQEPIPQIKELIEDFN
ncbi:kinase-like domain-containing protein [Melanogaster broomeanus]|nr:kinase-like domain-containing protein [Melanogaster broomeanus]